MMRRRLVLLVAVAVAASAIPAAAQVYPERVETGRRRIAEVYQSRDREGRAEQVDRSTKTVKIGTSGELFVQNIAGDIKISRGSGDEATIQIVRTARGRDDADAKEQLQLVPTEVVERGGRVEVRERYPQNGSSGRHNWHLTSTYTITAPAGTRVTAKSISGDISISDISGDVSIETVSGNVTLAGLGRVSNARSVSGNVDVSNTRVEGTLTLGSVSGDVVARKVTAEHLALSSVSGNITVEDVQCGRVEGHTTSGNTRFTGTLAKNGHYELKSFSGDVRLALSGDTGFELEASSFSGDVRSDLPLTTHGEEAGQGRRRRRTLSGTYGDGSAVLNLTTFSGSIVISKR